MFGIPIDTLDGATLDDKQSNLAKMNVDLFVSKCTESGFYTYLEAKSGILIPGKYAYVVINARDAPSHGVKWCATRVKVRIDEGIAFLKQFNIENGSNNDIVARTMHFLEEEALLEAE